MMFSNSKNTSYYIKDMCSIRSVLLCTRVIFPFHDLLVLIILYHHLITWCTDVSQVSSLIYTNTYSQNIPMTQLITGIYNCGLSSILGKMNRLTLLVNA